jgi:hypothetical protein
MPAMNAYLFTALATISQLRPNNGRYGPGETYQTWDASFSLIVLDDHPEPAQKRFEDWLHTQPEGENPVEVGLKKIAATQFVDQLLTESGGGPLDWMAIWKQWLALAEATSVDDFEQGYWADVEQCVPAGKMSANIEALQRDLPDDIRAGLNWSEEKKFTFILSVLSPPAPPPAEQPEEVLDDADETEVQRLLALYPQAADKEAAAVIQARNSVVAAWLWRKFAAGTRLAAHQIRIDSLCMVLGLKPEEDPSGGSAA